MFVCFKCGVGAVLGDQYFSHCECRRVRCHRDVTIVVFQGRVRTGHGTVIRVYNTGARDILRPLAGSLEILPQEDDGEEFRQGVLEAEILAVLDS